MRRAAYTNDISKPPIVLRVLGSIVKWTLIALLAGLVAAAAYFVVRGYALYNNAAQEKSVADMVTDIESRAGFTPLEELPETYLAAVVSVEDHRFYQHPGFDALATGRALFNDLRAGAIVEGGSTITQQLAKNEFFSQEQVVERKIAEVFMAFDIERALGKDRILELYVNSIYFGEGLYGIGPTSSRIPGQGTCHERLGKHHACDANAPSVYAPTVNYDLACQRQRQVLEQMVKYHAITQEDANAIAAQANESPWA
ncbi:MAG: transglycosylase domain-containing protein [Eggerthellaceae bacterium]